MRVDFSEDLLVVLFEFEGEQDGKGCDQQCLENKE